MLIEFSLGTLPWRKMKDKEQIGQMKIQYNTPELVKDLPPQFLQFMEYLQTLQYESTPDYQLLLSLLREVAGKVAATANTAFDWELNNNATTDPSRVCRFCFLFVFIPKLFSRLLSVCCVFLDDTLALSSPLSLPLSWLFVDVSCRRTRTSRRKRSRPPAKGSLLLTVNLSLGN